MSTAAVAYQSVWAGSRTSSPASSGRVQCYGSERREEGREEGRGGEGRRGEERGGEGRGRGGERRGGEGRGEEGKGGGQG